MKFFEERVIPRKETKLFSPSSQLFPPRDEFSICLEYSCDFYR